MFSLRHYQVTAEGLENGGVTRNGKWDTLAFFVCFLLPRSHFLPFFSLMYSKQSIFQDQMELDVCKKTKWILSQLRDEGKS